MHHLHPVAAVMLSRACAISLLLQVLSGGLDCLTQLTIVIHANSNFKAASVEEVQCKARELLPKGAQLAMALDWHRRDSWCDAWAP